MDDVDRDPRLIQLMDLIKDHHTDPNLSIKFLADSVGLSQTQLREIVFKYLRTHPNELVESYRIHRAVELLVGSTLSVQEIAAGVGYWNTKTFRNAFRRRHGKSPTRFRSKADENYR